MRFLTLLLFIFFGVFGKAYALAIPGVAGIPGAGGATGAGGIPGLSGGGIPGLGNIPGLSGGGIPGLGNIPGLSGGGLPGLPGSGSLIKKDAAPKPDAGKPDLENLPGGKGNSSINMEGILVNPQSGVPQDKNDDKDDGLTKEKVDNIILPSIHYSDPYRYSLGIAYYMPDNKSREFRNFFVQGELGVGKEGKLNFVNSVNARLGLLEISPVGFGYSIATSLRKTFKIEGAVVDNLLPGNTTYIGVDFGTTFSLVSARMSLVYPVQGDTSNGAKLFLSVGIGLF